jgi:hypothetical protein
VDAWRPRPAREEAAAPPVKGKEETGGPGAAASARGLGPPKEPRGREPARGRLQRRSVESAGAQPSRRSCLYRPTLTDPLAQRIALLATRRGHPGAVFPDTRARPRIQPDPRLPRPRTTRPVLLLVNRRGETILSRGNQAPPTHHQAPPGIFHGCIDHPSLLKLSPPFPRHDFAQIPVFSGWHRRRITG